MRFEHLSHKKRRKAYEKNNIVPNKPSNNEYNERNKIPVIIKRALRRKAATVVHHINMYAQPIFARNRFRHIAPFACSTALLPLKTRYFLRRAPLLFDLSNIIHQKTLRVKGILKNKYSKYGSENRCAK